jgi:hypothetical protein
MNSKQKENSKKEILNRLIWFHGEEIEKYPLTEDLLELYQKGNGF